MNKLFDRLIWIFIKVYEIVLYSLALPLVLGGSLLVGEISRYLIRGNLFLYIGFSVFVGLCLKIWRDEVRRNKPDYDSKNDIGRLPFHDNIVKWVRSGFNG